MWPLCIFWIRANTKTVIILITARAIQWRIQDFPDGAIPAEFGAKTYIYRPQRSCGKVMFSQASVILSTGDVAETPLDRHPPGRHPLCPVHAGIHTASLVHAGINSPPPSDGHCCGRYASYWNAFLFGKFFTENCMNMNEIGP